MISGVRQAGIVRCWDELHHEAGGGAVVVVTRMFDALFVNQLFHTNEQGQTIFYPNGMRATGYPVPPEREPNVKSGVRRLVIASLLAVLVVVVIVPRIIESWLGYTIPLGWFIGGAVVATVLIVAAIIKRLSQLTVGLEAVAR